MAVKGKKVVVLAGYAESLVTFRGQLLAAMVRAGHQVVACAPERPAKVVEALRALGVEYRSVELNRTGMNPLKDLGGCLRLRRLFRELKPDLFLGYTVKPVIYGSIAARLAGIPRRYSMITGLGYAFSGSTLRHRLVRALVCRLFRLSLPLNDKVLFQNPDDLSLFAEEGLIASKEQGVLVNGSGVDLAAFSPAPLPPGEPVFLLIARLLKDKGIPEFVEAARMLKERCPRARFVLLGPLDSNPAAISARQVAEWREAGIIEYPGETEDVRPFIARASVFVLPSAYREGTPRTILEAMAMGRPIVTTDTPGCRETVVEGENGFLVPAKNAAALAVAMERFILEPGLSERMGRASLRIATEKYDVHLVNQVIMSSLGL